MLPAHDANQAPNLQTSSRRPHLLIAYPAEPNPERKRPGTEEPVRTLSICAVWRVRPCAGPCRSCSCDCLGTPLDLCAKQKSATITGTCSNLAEANLVQGRCGGSGASWRKPRVPSLLQANALGGPAPPAPPPFRRKFPTGHSRISGSPAAKAGT